MEAPNFDLLGPEESFPADETDEPPPKKARFGSVRESEMLKFATEAVPAATKKTTKTWITVFEAYLREKNISLNLHTVNAGDLAKVLRQLYVEVRKQDGSTYQRPSLMGLRAAIQRHIRSPPFNRKDLNIIGGSDFDEANGMLDAYLKHLAKEGHLRPQEHKQPMTKPLEKCFKYFYDKAEQPQDPHESCLVFPNLSFCAPVARGSGKHEGDPPAIRQRWRGRSNPARGRIPHEESSRRRPFVRQLGVQRPRAGSATNSPRSSSE